MVVTGIKKIADHLISPGRKPLNTVYLLGDI
jgi:hypothetical protein